MMNIKYEMNKGIKFEHNGVMCTYNVSTFTNEKDLNKALEWYKNREENYEDIRIRVCSIDYNGTVGIQILTLEKEMFEFYEYKKNKEVLKATGA